MALYQTSITLARPDGGTGVDSRIIGQFGEDDDPKTCLLTAERSSENPDSFHVVYMGDEKIIFDLEEFRDILTKMVNTDDDFRRLPYTQATFDHWQRIRHEATLPLMTELAHLIEKRIRYGVNDHNVDQCDVCIMRVISCVCGK
jgi:hypothetical protein